ncbi:MAG: LysM peptidoglycan-binding domain-containing protein [Bacteroidetes bacterium]|nr:LysM peptidoglycan-binding domain-containing protein [Bacteroidota bacterium]
MMPAVDGNTSPMYAQGSQPNQPSSTAGGEWVSKPSRYHTVRRGETLSTIGRRYGITVQSLRSWNHLSGSSIGVGQKLIVQRATAVPAAVASATSSTPTAVSTDTLAEAEVAQDVAASREANTASRPSNPAVRRVPTYNYYTVRKGDTLWDIAQRKGITVAELQKANKLTKSSRLQPGQRLKIAAG